MTSPQHRIEIHASDTGQCVVVHLIGEKWFPPDVTIESRKQFKEEKELLDPLIKVLFTYRPIQAVTMTDDRMVIKVNGKPWKQFLATVTVVIELYLRGPSYALKLPSEIKDNLDKALVKGIVPEPS